MCRTYNLQQFKHQLATLTLGCGAVAIVLCRSDLAPPGRNHRLTGAVARAAPYACGMCRGDLEKMETDPKMVLHGGLVINQTWQVAKKAFGWSADNVALFVAHQVRHHGVFD
jgi:3-oxoacyl-[acyl-carrier-protein] synthase-3